MFRANRYWTRACYILLSTYLHQNFLKLILSLWISFTECYRWGKKERKPGTVDRVVEDLCGETEEGGGQSDWPNGNQSEEERGHEHDQPQVEPI